MDSDPLQSVWFLAFIAGGAGLWKLIHWFTKELESSLSPKTLKTIKDAVRGIEPRMRAEQWLDSSIGLFDKVFTDRHLSLSFFIRSTLATFGSVLFLSGIYASLAIGSDAHDLSSSAMKVLLISACFNVIPDYISLLETRVVLGVAHRLGGRYLWAWIFIDVALTFLIAAFTSVLLPLMAIIVAAGDTPFLEVRWFATLFNNASEMLRALPATVVFNIPVGVLFWSTFFSTLWLLAYTASIALVKVASGFEWIRGILDIENKPLSALGFVFGGVCASFWWLICLIRYLW